MRKPKMYGGACEICGKPRGGAADHRQCSKELLVLHANDKRPRPARKNPAIYKNARRMEEFLKDKE